MIAIDPLTMALLYGGSMLLDYLGGQAAAGQQQEASGRENAREDQYNSNLGQHQMMLMNQIMAPMGVPGMPGLNDPSAFAPQPNMGDQGMAPQGGAPGAGAAPAAAAQAGGLPPEVLAMISGVINGPPAQQQVAPAQAPAQDPLTSALGMLLSSAVPQMGGLGLPGGPGGQPQGSPDLMSLLQMLFGGKR